MILEHQFQLSIQEYFAKKRNGKNSLNNQKSYLKICDKFSFHSNLKFFWVPTGRIKNPRKFLQKFLSEKTYRKLGNYN